MNVFSADQPVLLLSMNKSAILLPNWIGDMLLALSLVMKMPEERRAGTTLLVPRHMAELVEVLSGMPHITYARRTVEERKATISAVRQRMFDSIFLLPYSFSSALFAYRTGIPRRRGLSREMRGFLLTERLPGNLRDRNCHITREYAAILDVPFAEPELWQGSPVVSDHAYRGSVVFCPGAEYGPAKKWMYFADLARLLEGERIVILGTASDRQAAADVVQAVPDRVTDLTGKTTLPEAASIMSGARLVVSNDSGLMHLAGFLGTPVAGIFGSTSPVWTRPNGSKTSVLFSNEPCAPCFRRTCRYGHYRCLHDIGPLDVVKAMKTLC